MIRAYITKWWVVDPDGIKLGVLNRPTPAELSLYPGRRLMHPLLEWAEANLSVPMRLNMHYSDADSDGLPDNDYLLVLAESSAEIAALKDLPDVGMLPPYNFNQAVSALTQAQIDEAFQVTDIMGIPQAVFSGSQTCGEFLKRIATYMSPSHQGFGVHIELLRAAEFE